MDAAWICRAQQDLAHGAKSMLASSLRQGGVSGPSRKPPSCSPSVASLNSSRASDLGMIFGWCQAQCKITVLFLALLSMSQCRWLWICIEHQKVCRISTTGGLLKGVRQTSVKSDLDWVAPSLDRTDGVDSTVSHSRTILPPLPQRLEVHPFRTLQPMCNAEMFLALESCA